MTFNEAKTPVTEAQQPASPPLVVRNANAATAANDNDAHTQSALEALA